ncbi:MULTISPECIES: hypothetical protein [Phyllobacterium]|jgi:hypothetical protein|uniref:hypothetical protein n=1 Tax=Phyllobacterium TaxID=28100 RepID=UPI001CBD4EA9|nr:hypothetical protein [Phyllobacterium calauticae]MBZ3695451.1 hypothetical protein [Phyllobacterium calauticae]
MIPTVQVLTVSAELIPTEPGNTEACADKTPVGGSFTFPDSLHYKEDSRMRYLIFAILIVILIFAIQTAVDFFAIPRPLWVNGLIYGVSALLVSIVFRIDRPA